MEDNKYYTPQPEEFYLGYEYEYMRDPSKGWIKDIADDRLFADHCYYGDSKRVRSKYLDKQDIESLGWQPINEVQESWKLQKFETKFHILHLWSARVDNIGLSTIKIMTKEDWQIMGSYKGYDEVKYDGVCKSINELRKLMNWLSI